jgi:hypothetical protein
VVVDENGQPLNTTGSEDTTTVGGSDPWWTSGGIKYAVVTSADDCPEGTSAGSTCWVDANPITYALQKIDNEGLVPTDGNLYVLAGSYTENVVIDAISGNGNLSKLKGLIGESSGTVSLTGSISISNTTLGFTLSGFTIDGSVSLNQNSGILTLNDLYIQNDSGTGLTVEKQNGNVIMTNVQSRDNHGDGAHIDNSVSSSVRSASPTAPSTTTTMKAT